MKQTGKSTSIPHDAIRLRYLKYPQQAAFALKLALKDFESDGDVNALLDTLRLVAQAQGESHSWPEKPTLAGKPFMKPCRRTGTHDYAHFRACSRHSASRCV